MPRARAAHGDSRQPELPGLLCLLPQPTKVRLPAPAPAPAPGAGSWRRATPPAPPQARDPRSKPALSPRSAPGATLRLLTPVTRSALLIRPAVWMALACCASSLGTLCSTRRQLCPPSRHHVREADLSIQRVAFDQLLDHLARAPVIRDLWQGTQHGRHRRRQVRRRANFIEGEKASPE